MSSPRISPRGLSLHLLLILILVACERRGGVAVQERAETPFIPPEAVFAVPSRTITPEEIPQGTSDLSEDVPPQSTEEPVRFLNDPSLPRSRYDLSIDFDYERHELVVLQGLTYVNRSSEPLNDLVLIVEPNRQEGVFELLNFEWAGGQEIESFELDGAYLHLPLPKPLLPWNTLQLDLSYHLTIPNQASTFGYTKVSQSILHIMFKLNTDCTKLKISSLK